MNLPIANISAAELDTQIIENEFGETALPYAPAISASDGSEVIPQQFLDVNRSLQSVEAILTRIQVPENFLLFAGEENGIVYLLCSVIGHENYIKRAEQKNELKMVYGRRWLLEPSTPTSEVVQTALLAIKKAREHELRERVIIHVDGNGADSVKRTTPFNCHMDLPLMVSAAEHLMSEAQGWQIETLLSRINVDNLQPCLYATHNLNGGRKLYDIRLENIGKAALSFADLDGQMVSVLCEKDTQAEFLHQLFAALLALSDGYIDENTRFEHFARFSQDVCPIEIAKFSYRTRNISHQDERFGEHFKDMSYRVDEAKAPDINSGELGEMQRRVLKQTEAEFGDLAGYLPHGYQD